MNFLLALLPPRILKILLNDKHVLKWLANWQPGLVETEDTRYRTEASRGTMNIYNIFCESASHFMNAQDTPPTGDAKPAPGETAKFVKQCYNTSLYTSEQNREACDRRHRRDALLREHAMHGGGLLVVEQCRTSMVERGGVDMVDYIMSLRPFRGETGDEPRWTPVLDEKTSQPLRVIGHVVFLYMEVDTDDELRLVAVVNNPSNILDSNTDRKAHTLGTTSTACATLPCGWTV